MLFDADRRAPSAADFADLRRLRQDPQALATRSSDGRPRWRSDFAS
jgi:hypothetical protein